MIYEGRMLHTLADEMIANLGSDTQGRELSSMIKIWLKMLH